MSVWKEVALNDVAELTVGFVGKTATHYVDKGVRFLRSLNVTPFRINYNDEKYIDKEFHNKIRKSELKTGDVVIVRTGKPGACAVIPEKTEEWNCSDLVIIKPDHEKINSTYLAAFINLAYGVINAHTVGAVQQHFNVGSAKRMKIKLPPMDIQEKIGFFIDDINKKIATNEKINDNLFEQMQCLYKSWFVEYEPFGGARPESWIQSDIYTLANIIYGAPFASKQFNTEGEGKPIIRIRDLKEQKFTTYTTEVHPKGYLLQPGDIVVGMDGEFRPYIWGNDEAWLNQRLCVFENKRPNGKAFLYFTIKPLLYAIEQTQVATTVIHIGKKDYDSFEITLPDSLTLDNFDSFTAPMVKQIVSNYYENKRLVAIRDALLPKLISGEIDVSEVNI